MAQKTRAQLTAELNSLITDPLNRQNTAARVRQIIQDIIDSQENLIDDASSELASADNGLSTTGGTSGQTIELGGSLIKDTNIDMLGNQFNIYNSNTGWELIKRTNQRYMIIGGLGNNTWADNNQPTSQILFGGQNNINSTFGAAGAVVLFGSVHNISGNSSDIWLLGDYGNVVDSFIVNSFGRGNNYSGANTVSIVGNANTINSSSNLTVLGQNATIKDSDKIYIANGNKYIVFDASGNTGYGTIVPKESIHISGGTIRINDSGSTYGAGKLAVSDANGSISFSSASAVCTSVVTGITAGYVPLGGTLPGSPLSGAIAIHTGLTTSTFQDLTNTNNLGYSLGVGDNVDLTNATNFSWLQFDSQNRVVELRTLNQNGLFGGTSGTSNVSVFGNQIQFYSADALSSKDAFINILPASNKINAGSSNISTFKGIEYFSDFSANYSPLSLITYKDLTGATQGVYIPLTGTATGNPLAGTIQVQANARYPLAKLWNSGASDMYIGVGDNLTLTSAVNVAYAGFVSTAAANQSSLIAADSGGNNPFFKVSASDAGIGSLQYADMGYFVSTHQTKFRLQDGSAVMSSNVSGFGGIKYASDYSTDYTLRSLVDKEYVDKNITGATSLSISGTSGYIPVFTSSGNTLTNSILFQSGTGLTLNGSVQIYGNVDILGTASTFNTQSVSTKDNNISMNLSGSHVSALYGGITVLSGTPANTSSTWLIDANGSWSANTAIITSAITVSGLPTNAIPISSSGQLINSNSLTWSVANNILTVGQLTDTAYLTLGGGVRSNAASRVVVAPNNGQTAAFLEFQDGSGNLDFTVGRGTTTSGYQINSNGVSFTTLTIPKGSGNIGIGGVASPSAFTHINSATTTNASLRLAPGYSQVANPGSGDIWNDQNYLNIGVVGLSVTGNSRFSGVTATTLSAVTLSASTHVRTPAIQAPSALQILNGAGAQDMSVRAIECTSGSYGSNIPSAGVIYVSSGIATNGSNGVQVLNGGSAQMVSANGIFLGASYGTSVTSGQLIANRNGTEGNFITLRTGGNDRLLINTLTTTQHVQLTAQNGIDLRLGVVVSNNNIDFLRIAGTTTGNAGALSNGTQSFAGTERVNFSGTSVLSAVSITTRIFNTPPASATANSGQTVDWGTTNNFSYTLSANTTFTLSNTINGQTIVMDVSQPTNNSGLTTTFTAGTTTIKWQGGNTPTQTPTSGKTDVYTFIQSNGIIYGVVSPNF